MSGSLSGLARTRLCVHAKVCVSMASHLFAAWVGGGKLTDEFQFESKKSTL